MSRRRRRQDTANWFELPALPFLSIMLGMLSVMALISLALTVEARADKQDIKGVEMVGIPAGFSAFNVRCSQEQVLWQRSDGTWSYFGETGIVGMLQGESLFSSDVVSAIQFRQLLVDKTFENRELSYSNQQNTLIIWVEPDGGRMALTLRYLIDRWKLPLRVGMLPIFPGEEIYRADQ